MLVSCNPFFASAHSKANLPYRWSLLLVLENDCNGNFREMHVCARHVKKGSRRSCMTQNKRVCDVLPNVHLNPQSGGR